MFTRAAKHISRILSYPANLLNAATMVAMIFVMLIVTIEVTKRYITGWDIYGVRDLTTIGFSVIVWGPMAWAALKGMHIRLTFVVDRLPRLLGLSLELIGELVSGVILGMVSWQLVAYAMTMAANRVDTGVLRLPLAPWGYFAAVACGVMALAFLAKIPETIGKIRKEPESMAKVQKGH
jgi:TRAP-type C4-dicarboxylate transport system permease small subunit